MLFLQPTDLHKASYSNQNMGLPKACTNLYLNLCLHHGSTHGYACTYTMAFKTQPLPTTCNIMDESTP